MLQQPLLDAQQRATSKDTTGLILVTGGSGYLGSHTILELLNVEKSDVIVVDNFTNSSIEAIKRVEKLTGRGVTTYQLDLLDMAGLEALFDTHEEIEAVFHFAGLKSVSESWSNPIGYYAANVTATLNLLNCIKKHPKCDKFIYSSSACVYGVPVHLPVNEDAECSPASPYGRTKLQAEMMIRDVCRRYNGKEVDKRISAVILRYFNPVGAHVSGLIGEDPQKPPQNLMPILVQVAMGEREYVEVYGGDWRTADGTGKRDYLHVCDLASGHLNALRRLQDDEKMAGRQEISNNCGEDGGDDNNCLIYNLGAGRSYSVLELIHGMEKASGRKISYKIVEKRKGDVEDIYADVKLARKELGWTVERSLDEMCRDAWRWATLNPTGY